MKRKTHLAMPGRFPISSNRPACSPVWVNDQGEITSVVTRYIEFVTCLSCKRTKFYKEKVNANVPQT